MFGNKKKNDDTIDMGTPVTMNDGTVVYIKEPRKKRPIGKIVAGIGAGVVAALAGGIAIAAHNRPKEAVESVSEIVDAVSESVTDPEMVSEVVTDVSEQVELIV